MKIALVQFSSWDKLGAYDPHDLVVKEGDFVVVSAASVLDLGRVIEIKENAAEGEWELLGSVDRLATDDDLSAYRDNNPFAVKQEAIDYCHRLAKRQNLEMKVVDCFFSLDGKRLVFAFIADGRVDFRSLVKDLTRHFQRSIRMHQLGVRDEAKISGDIGSCGKGLCCREHLRTLGNVTSELAEEQQIAHRGSERLSGICGRLKCCLAYEKELYEELIKKLPPVGTRVKTAHGRGVVIGWHVLRCSVDVKIDPDKEGDKQIIVEVPIKK
jgi:cell fate regulator YaaT (PSP1 superfamily)